MENSFKVLDEYLGTTVVTPATVREKRVALWSSSTSISCHFQLQAAFW